MKIAFWDTNVLRLDGKIMHFDILVPEELKDFEVILQYGISYIKTKPFKTKKLTADECTFCQVDDISEKQQEQLFNQIKEQGYAIIELQHCN